MGHQAMGLASIFIFPSLDSQDTRRFSLTDIELSNATLTVNGKAYSQHLLDNAQGTLWVSLLVDVSRAVNESGLVALKESLLRAISGLPADARIAFVPFNRTLLQKTSSFVTVSELPALINAMQATPPDSFEGDLCTIMQLIRG